MAYIPWQSSSTDSSLERKPPKWSSRTIYHKQPSASLCERPYSYMAEQYAATWRFKMCLLSRLWRNCSPFNPLCWSDWRVTRHYNGLLLQYCSLSLISDLICPQMQAQGALILQLYRVQFFKALCSNCFPLCLASDLLWFQLGWYINHTVHSEQGQHCDFNILQITAKYRWTVFHNYQPKLKLVMFPCSLLRRVMLITLFVTFF